MKLICPDLWKTQAWLNQASGEVPQGHTFPVVDPATGETIAEVPLMGKKDTLHAIEVARQMQPVWAALPGKERGRILRRLSELMRQHQEDLARLITREQGKPLAEARREITAGADHFDWYAEEARRLYGELIPAPHADKRFMVIKQAAGVAAAITPWNFPSSMIARKASAALAAGCSMVIKPAEQTPLSALALAGLAIEAGLPEGVLSIITTDTLGAATVGKVLCRHPDVRVLSFTGSTSVGRLLMRQAAGTVKKVALELGGNAPFIVFDDADLEAAVEGAFASKFRNSGQACVCANRFFLQDGIHDEFVRRFVARAKQVRLGNGLESGTDQGPLISPHAAARVQLLVDDALQQGATLQTGGKPAIAGSAFFEPTVLTGVTTKMRVFQEEIFGPVAPITRFSCDKDVVRLANMTHAGLAGYFYSQNIKRIFQVAEALECGMVGVNTGQVSTPEAPFGGIKQSGLGKESSKYGIEEYLETKLICLGDVV